MSSKEIHWIILNTKKPNKKIKKEFMSERLKKSYIDGSLALSDYLYAVGA
jgi:hypothetical protein